MTEMIDIMAAAYDTNPEMELLVKKLYSVENTIENLLNEHNPNVELVTQRLSKLEELICQIPVSGRFGLTKQWQMKLASSWKRFNLISNKQMMVRLNANLQQKLAISEFVIEKLLADYEIKRPQNESKILQHKLSELQDLIADIDDENGANLANEWSCKLAKFWQKLSSHENTLQVSPKVSCLVEGRPKSKPPNLLMHFEDEASLSGQFSSKFSNNTENSNSLEQSAILSQLKNDYAELERVESIFDHESIMALVSLTSSVHQQINHIKSNRLKTKAFSLAFAKLPHSLQDQFDSEFGDQQRWNNLQKYLRKLAE